MANDARDGDAMAQSQEIRQLFPEGLPSRRRRRRWVIAISIGVAWVFLISETGSIVGGTVISLLLAVAVGGSLAVLRTLGFDREHPWVQRMRTRPWRNGQDVLRLGLRHLPEVLIITPNQSRVAPNSVELQMSPEDLFSLAESLDLEFINSSATECYETMLRKRSVRPRCRVRYRSQWSATRLSRLAASGSGRLSPLIPRPRPIGICSWTTAGRPVTLTRRRRRPRPGCRRSRSLPHFPHSG